jgi:hypothetical protein
MKLTNTERNLVKEYAKRLVGKKLNGMPPCYFINI